jgi:hypothetical protein
VEFNIYVNTTQKVARTAITGTGNPSVAPVYQSHLLLNVYFFAEGEAAALLTGTPTFVVAFKDQSDPTSDVLLQLTAPTTTGATGYEFEWDYIDSVPLAALLGDNASVPTMLEIVWVIDGVRERVQIPCSIANSWQRISDSAPDFTPYQVNITSTGYLRLVKPDGSVFNLGLNTGEPPT